MGDAQEVRIRVYYNDGSYADISDRLIRGPKISKDVDSDDWSTSLTFNNNDNQVKDDKSLDPWDENSDYNNNNGEYEPLLAWYHKVKIWAKSVKSGDWNLRFEGFCGSGKVRTWIQVAYKNDLRGGIEELTDPVTDEDAKKKYGIWKGDGKRHHRKMRMVEKEDSWINTPGEAVKYATFALNDLSTMKPELSSVRTNERKGEVSFKPYGRGHVYKDDRRLTKYHYQDRDLASNLLRSILLDSNFSGRMARVVIEDDPNLQIGNYPTREGTTWEALQKPVKKTGYKLTMKYWDSGTSYNDGSGEVISENGFYLTLLDPQRDKTTVDHSYTGEIAKRKSSKGRGQTFSIEKDIFDKVSLHDLVEFDGKDYFTQLGVTSIKFNWSPDTPFGKTEISGVADKIIGDRDYWLRRDITEEERNRRRNNFLKGEIEKLPKPKNLSWRSHVTQSNDGNTVGNLIITWERPNAWWYDYTEIWISVGKKTRFGKQPRVTSAQGRVEIYPFPPGADVYIKAKNVPKAFITNSGKR